MTGSLSRPEIMFVTLSLDRGGTERHLASILPGLAAAGWPVSIYCLASAGELAPAVARAGVNVIAPPLGGASAQNGAARAMRFFFSGLKLGRIFLMRKPGIVHFFLPAPYLIGAPLAILFRRPFLIMSRRSLNYYQDNHLLAARAERWLHRRMTAVLGNSKKVVVELVDEEGCDPEKVGLIYNGIDASLFRDPEAQGVIRERLGLQDAKFVACVIANLLPYKGHADLIHALGQVKDRLPQPFIVLCAGRDQGCESDLTKLAGELGLSQNIRFLGGRPDVPAILKASDIAILCSHEEGFSNAVIESMAAGLPSVVTDVGGNAEAVRDKIDGLVVPSKCPSALGQAILELALDPVRRSEMAASASQRAGELYSLDACVSNYQHIYQSIMESGTIRPRHRF